jgi:hypothetical protein
MTEKKTDRPAKELDESAYALLAALASCSDTNLVQGSPEDALIDGMFDLTSVVRELRTNGYEIHKRV